MNRTIPSSVQQAGATVKIEAAVAVDMDFSYSTGNCS